MRRQALEVAIGLLLAGAGPARSASLPFTGTFGVQFGTAAPVTIAGAGTAVVNGSGGAGHLAQLQLPGSAFQASQLVQPVTDPEIYPIVGVQLTAHNGTGTVAGNGGAGFGGTLPLFGAAKACLYAPCSIGVANLTVPLSVVGQGGMATIMNHPLGMTVIGAPWTTGTVVVGGYASGTAWVGAYTAMGGVEPLSSTGAPGGRVTLVTPIVISTTLSSSIVPAFGVLTLHFVPEPTTLGLLGAGIALLVAHGRRRALA